MNKKILISAAVVAVVVIGAGTAYWNAKPRLDPEIQKRIDIIVKGREWNPYGNGKERTPSWPLIAKISQEPKLEQWDAKHQQPQVMFTFGRDNPIYTMNINGTDVRLLVDREELGELPASGYNIRSSNGRYLSMHYARGLDPTACLIYDLKDRKIVAKMRTCWDGTFSHDSRSYYYSDTSPIHNQPRKIDLATGDESNLLPEKFTIDGELYYLGGDTQTFMINDELSLLIWSGSKTNPGGEIIKRVQVGFDLDTFKLKEVKNYLDPACQDQFDYNPNQNYFICGDNMSRENYVFSKANPDKQIENAPIRNVIQQGGWYFKGSSGNYGNTLVRYRQPNEAGMFDKITYYYKLQTGKKGDFDRLSHLNMFIPQNLAQNFDQVDLGSFFPPIPTQEQYDESYQRQLKARKEGK
ncbi:hypothetical protein SAMN04488136_12128 [Vibrio xiamenensis]|uniref:Uncharacterized protein n=1 Tax=Vibrio xiamenensis TaxID=861298 RepID=A0A1G8DS79_9VIBR|nr:hypothetical protein [Vibrio xiamenensis]SDH60279.1 hypothetical protein SAMN04488136_12128 [Vibrio xiamenensis]